MSEQKLIINPEWEHAQFVSIAELKQCEQKLEAANAEIERLTAKVAQLYEGAEELKQRIKRLEEAGNELMYDNDDIANINRWNKAKEAKL